MQINLSDEMIYKITSMAFARIHDLQYKEKAIKRSIAVGETQIDRKKSHLKRVKESKKEAMEIWEMFNELLQETEDEN